jgi:hypothetical protein
MASVDFDGVPYIRSGTEAILIWAPALPTDGMYHFRDPRFLSNRESSRRGLDLILPKWEWASGSRSVQDHLHSWPSNGTFRNYIRRGPHCRDELRRLGWNQAWKGEPIDWGGLRVKIKFLVGGTEIFRWELRTLVYLMTNLRFDVGDRSYCILSC